MTSFEQMLSQTYPDSSSVAERVYNNLTRSTQNTRMEDRRQLDAVIRMFSSIVEKMHSAGALTTAEIDSMLLQLHLSRSDLEINH